jgi:hypothetical protein
MKKKYLLLPFLFLFSIAGIAQEGADVRNTYPPPVKGDIQLHFLSGIPTGQLKGNMDPGFGFGVTAVAGKRGLPIKAGINFGALWHNRASLEIYYYNGSFDELHDIATTSHTFQGDLVIRIEPELDFPIVPYVDVFFGFNRFVTWTSISGDDEYEDDRSLDNFDERYREKGDWTRAYGAALGCKVRLIKSLGTGDPALHINIRAGYRKGGVADYLTKKEDYDIIDSPLDAFEEKSSLADMITLQLGVSLGF